MKIYLRELSEEEKEFHYDENEAWLAESVAKADEAPAPTGRQIQFDIAFSKVDSTFIGNGTIQTPVRLLCSICGDPFDLECNHSFSEVYTQDPDTAGLSEEGGRHGTSKTSHDFESAETDIEINFLQEKFIDLKELVSGQVLNQIPIQPKCGKQCQPYSSLSSSISLNQDEKDSDNHPFADLQKLKKNWKLK